MPREADRMAGRARFHGARAGYCLRCYRHVSGQESRLHTQHCQNGCSHADPAVRVGTESEYPFPHAAQRWRVCRYQPWSRFRWVQVLSSAELTRLAHTIAHRVGRFLERQGLLERLCRYVSRPAISEKRLSLMPNDSIRYQMKAPCRDGTTHVIFEPLDLIARRRR